MKTLIKTAREKQKTTLVEIKESLKFNDFEHHNFLFETGMKFLEETLMSADYKDFLTLSCDKSFWNWYKNEWYIAESKWLKQKRTFKSSTPEMLRVLYTTHMLWHCYMAPEILFSLDNWLKIKNR